MSHKTKIYNNFHYYYLQHQKLITFIDQKVTLWSSLARLGLFLGSPSQEGVLGL